MTTTIICAVCCKELMLHEWNDQASSPNRKVRICGTHNNSVLPIPPECLRMHSPQIVWHNRKAP